MEITRRNRNLFTRLALGVAAEEQHREMAVVEHNPELLDHCSELYARLGYMRESRKRNVDFFFGRQLGDIVYDRDKECYVTEEEMLRDRGYPPIVSNLIYKIVRNMTSLYNSNSEEPYCIARDRDEQKIGEMMSIAVQYIYQKYNIHVNNTRSFEEFCISSIVGWRVGYGWDEKRMEKDVYVEALDANRLFFDDNTQGLYMPHLKTIGYLHDMDLTDVEDLCGDNKALIAFVRDKYGTDSLRNAASEQQFKDKNKATKQFYSADHGKCRVIEVWDKAAEPSLRCWDIAKGEWSIVPECNEAKIIAINEQRRADMELAGGNANDAAIIEYEHYINRYWVCRYMTPDGYVIKRVDNPFWHNSHPFVVGAYPLVDGEIHSLVDVSIPTQKAINRLLQRIEFMRMASAKGVLIIPEQLLEGKDINKISKQWAKSNGVIALKWRDGIPMPQQMVGNSANVGDMEMVQMQMQLLDDITGVHRAMQGKPAQSGTPAALYQAELQSSQISVSDVMSWFRGCVRERDVKIMQVIQQYYDTPRYINIAGKDYEEESKWYDPSKCRNACVDLNISEGSGNTMYRTLNENILMQLLQMGGIDVETYLESSNAPFADRLLERIKARKEELQKQQQVLAQQGQQVNPMIEQAMQ